MTSDAGQTVNTLALQDRYPGFGFSCSRLLNLAAQVFISITSESRKESNDWNPIWREKVADWSGCPKVKQVHICDPDQTGHQNIRVVVFTVSSWLDGDWARRTVVHKQAIVKETQMRTT